MDVKAARLDAIRSGVEALYGGPATPPAGLRGRGLPEPPAPLPASKLLAPTAATYRRRAGLDIVLDQLKAHEREMNPELFASVRSSLERLGSKEVLQSAEFDKRVSAEVTPICMKSSATRNGYLYGDEWILPDAIAITLTRLRADPEHPTPHEPSRERSEVERARSALAQVDRFLPPDLSAQVAAYTLDDRTVAVLDALDALQAGGELNEAGLHAAGEIRELCLSGLRNWDSKSATAADRDLADPAEKMARRVGELGLDIEKTKPLTNSLVAAGFMASRRQLALDYLEQNRARFIDPKNDGKQVGWLGRRLETPKEKQDRRLAKLLAAAAARMDPDQVRKTAEKMVDKSGNDKGDLQVMLRVLTEIGRDQPRR